MIIMPKLNSLSIAKRIYWGSKTDKETGRFTGELDTPVDGKHRCSVHLLVGYCPQTIPYYLEMIKELRKTFKGAKIADIGCHQVRQSDCVKGYTLIVWNGLLEHKEYAGYYASLKGCDYYY
jgi:hypothetical protein